MDTHTGLLWAILAADNGGGGRREAGRKSSDYSSAGDYAFLEFQLGWRPIRRLGDVVR